MTITTIETGWEPSRAAVSSFVTHYHRYDRMMAQLGPRMLDAAALGPGDRVIDVGCGAGTVTLEAARMVGPRGAAVGIDVDSHAIALADQRSRFAGIDNVGFIEGDAGAFPFPDGAADAVVSRFGVLHFDEPSEAFANLHDALRPGGRLSFVCARGRERNEWASVPARVVAEVFGDPPPSSSGPFAFSDPGLVEALLSSARFVDVRLESIDVSVSIADDIDDAVEFFANTDGRAIRAALGSSALTRVLDALARELRPYAHADGVWLGMSVWLVTACTNRT